MLKRWRQGKNRAGKAGTIRSQFRRVDSSSAHPSHRHFVRSRLSQCIALASCALTQPLWALGLGDIESSSILGQRLQAQISVISDDQNLSAEEIRVSRISANEAEALGIDLMSDVSGIRLRTERHADGLKIRVDSRDVINEPFLNFVVKMEWPSGSVYREYTLLLDPPTITRAAQSSEAIAVNRLSPLKPQSTPKASSERQSVRVQNTARTALVRSRNDQYRVQIGDSLLALAERWLQQSGTESGYTLEAVAQWLLDNNPQAFTGGNANQLMAGVLLNFPTGNAPQTLVADVTALAPQPVPDSIPQAQRSSQASSQPQVASSLIASDPLQASVPRHLALGGEEDLEIWVAPALRAKKTLIADASIQASDFVETETVIEPQATQAPVSETAATQASVATEPAGRLRLAKAPAELEPSVYSDVDGGVNESLASVVQSQLDVTREVIDQLRRDNADLREQLARIEQSEYLTTLTELIRLQGLQLAELQARQNDQPQLQSQSQSSQPLRIAAVDNSSSLSRVTAEAQAAGLISMAPAAGSWAGLNPANPGASVNRVTRAVSLPGEASAFGGVSLAQFWRWSAVFGVPMLLMGVYLWVMAYQRRDLVPVTAEVEEEGFNLEQLAQLTNAELSASNTHTPHNHWLTHAETTTQYADMDQQKMNKMLEQGLQLSPDDQAQLANYPAPELEPDDESVGLDAAEELIDQSPYEDVLTQPIHDLDRDIDEMFDLAMQEGLEPAKDDQSAAAAYEESLKEEGSMEEGSMEAQPKADNILPFERPRRSDEELRQSIQDKCCDYHPPAEEDSGYIVKEGSEDIERYLDLQLMETPKISLDESRDNPLDKPQGE